MSLYSPGYESDEVGGGCEDVGHSLGAVDVVRALWRQDIKLMNETRDEEENLLARQHLAQTRTLA